MDDKILEDNNWYYDWVAKKYQDAIEKLDGLIEKEEDKKFAIQLKVMKALCQYKLDEKYTHIEDILTEHEGELEAYIAVGNMLMWEDFIDRAINIFKNGQVKFGNSIELIKGLADAHLKNENRELAISSFDNELTFLDSNATIQYANIYIEDKNFEAARAILHKAYLNLPNNRELCFKYASVATELNQHEIALFFYDKLVAYEPDNISYNGYLGNACLDLNLNDISLLSYKRANELSNGNKEWIISNIGNILKNRGF